MIEILWKLYEMTFHVDVSTRIFLMLWVGSDAVGQLHYVYTAVLLNYWSDTE